VGVNLADAAPVPPEFLYHSTASRFLDLDPPDRIAKDETASRASLTGDKNAHGRWRGTTL